MKPELSLKFAAIVVLTMVVGCSGASQDPYGRQAVEGTITLDGTPLDSGSIVFVPEDHGPVVSGTEVHAGQFSLPTSQGLPVGRYKVSITSIIPLLPAEMTPEDAMTEFPTKSLVPARYNTKTTLISEVSDQSPNVFAYDLKSK